MKKLIWGSEVMALAVLGAGARYVFLSKVFCRIERVRSFFANIPNKVRVGTSDDLTAMLKLGFGMSQSGHRTACIISSSDNVGFQVNPDNRIKSGFVYIIIEIGTTAHVRSYLLTERLSLFIPGNVSELYNMIFDAFDYSELMHMPAVICLSASLLSTAEIIGNNRMFPIGINLNDDRSDRRRLILMRIAGRYFKVSGKGKTALIAVGDICGILEEVIAAETGIRFIQLRRILPWPREILKRALEGAERIIVVIRKNVVLTETFDLSYETVIIDTMDSSETVIKTVREVLGGELRTHIRYLDTSELRPRRRVPTLPETGMRMCPGCDFRRELTALIDMTGRKTVIFEKVFCERYMTFVTSGITQKNVVFVNDESELYRKTQIEKAGVPLEFERRGGRECRINAGSHTKRFSDLSINHAICNACGICVSYTGCPALWERAFKVHLDRVKCNDCGMCVTKCERRAICII